MGKQTIIIDLHKTIKTTDRLSFVCVYTTVTSICRIFWYQRFWLNNFYRHIATPNPYMQ